MNKFFSDSYAKAFFRLTCAMLPLGFLGVLDADNSRLQWWAVISLSGAIALLIRCLWLLGHDRSESEFIGVVIDRTLGYPYYLLLFSFAFQSVGRDNVAFLGLGCTIIWIVWIIVSVRRNNITY